MERITLDEAWELPVMQCLNDIIYLNAKEIHDMNKLKKYGY